MRTIALIIVFVLGITGAVIYFLPRIIEGQEKTIEKLEKNIEFIKKENIPVKFKITEKEGDYIHFEIKYLDSKGKEVNKRNFILKGKELFFDFQVVKIDNYYLSFPIKVFSDCISPDMGIVIIDDYEKKGFPQIFYDEKLNTATSDTLTKIYAKIKSGEAEKDEDNFGNAVHDIKEFRSFQIGTVYKIIAHTKGGIEVLED